MNREAIESNLKEWLQNPTWKAYYEEAPSEKCKEYIALDFYASETESDEAFTLMDKMIRELDYESLNYLYHRAIGPEKAKYAAILSEKK